MNKVTIVTGFISVIFGGLISGYITRNKTWRYSALVTPLVWIISGTFFYLAMLFEEILLLDVFYMFIDNPANLILILCTIQVVLGRSCKYTIFDLTKEMCFIPLSKEKACKGKSIVDGIGSRLGKSLGATFYIFLLIMFGEMAATIPFAVILIFGITLLWIYSILKIDVLIRKKDKK